MHLTINGLRDNFRLADGQFEAFPAHGFNQDRQRHFAASLHLPSIWLFGGQHAQRNVTDQFLVQAVFQQAGGHLVATAAASQWRGIHADGHRNCWLIDSDAWQCLRRFWISDGIADHNFRDTRDSDDITSDCFLRRLAVETYGTQQLCDLDSSGLFIAVFVVMNPRNLLAFGDLTGVYTQ